MPQPAGFKQQGSRGKGDTMTNFGIRRCEGRRQDKILFKPRLFSGNVGGGLLKLKPSKRIYSGTQAKPVSAT